MKRIFLWIVTSMMICFGINSAIAQDSEVNKIKFTINISNAQAARCTFQGEELALADGANEFELPAESRLYIEPVSPWIFSSIKNKKGAKAAGFNGTNWYLYVDDSVQDEEFTITTIDINELRTSEFTLNVDDPSLVKATVTGYDTTLQLTPGENVIKFDPKTETYLNLFPTTSAPFYSVKLNGIEVAPQGNSYGIPLKNGCVIDVTAILPDEDRTVTFSYSGGAEGSISIKVNDAEMPEFNGRILTVKLGDRLTIEGKTGMYKFNGLKINGQDIDFYGSYTFAIMKNSDVYIDARPYSSISTAIIVNRPELISISNNGEKLDLSAGKNIIDLPENNATINWTVDPLAILNSVKVNDSESIPSYQSSYSLKAGDVIAFDLTEKQLDNMAVAWIDNVTGKACSTYLELSSLSDRSVRYEFDNGYNLMPFYEAMNPFSLSWSGSSEEIPDVQLTGNAYLNDRLLTPAYEGSTFYSFNLEDGDVLKLFMDSNPVVCNVVFDIAEGVDVSVKKDIITSVINPSDGFICFAGTEVTVSGKNIKVTVNGTEIEGTETEEDNEPMHTFVVNDTETTVGVVNDGGSRVASISMDADTDVYNMQGIKVGNSSQLKNLSPGIYIVGGRKVTIAH